MRYNPNKVLKVVTTARSDQGHLHCSANNLPIINYLHITVSEIELGHFFKCWGPPMARLKVKSMSYNHVAHTKQEESARERALCQLTECF